MRYRVIERRTDDGDVRLHALNLVCIFNPRKLREGDRTNV
jgi:hypothetical protein